MDVIKDYWAALMALIGAVVWLVRLEAGMLANRKDIRRIEDQRKEDNDRADRQRNKMEEKLDGIQGSIQEVLILLGNKADR